MRVPASDQYALACTYVELRCGRRPFLQKSQEALEVAHAQDTPDLSGLDHAEQQVIFRALAKKPKERFGSCLEMVTALDTTPAVTGSVENRPATTDGDKGSYPPGTIVPPSRPTSVSVPTPHSSSPSQHTPALSTIHDREPSPVPLKPSHALLWIVIWLCCIVGLAFLLYIFWPGKATLPVQTPGEVRLSLDASVCLCPGAPPCDVALKVDRLGFDGAIELTFDAKPDVRIGPVTIPAQSDTVRAAVAVTDTALPGPREISIKASPGATSTIEIQILPRFCKPTPKANLDRRGTPYFDRVVQRIDDLDVLFVLVRPVSPDARPFYLMQNKVCNKLFRAYAAVDPVLAAKAEWKLGGLAAGENVRGDNDFLPVFRITRPQAEAFAKKRGGRLPLAAELDQAMRRDSSRASRHVVGRWREGPEEVSDQDADLIQDLQGNGREWTGDGLPPGNETLAVLRGRSYAAPRVEASDKVDPSDTETTPTQRPTHPSPFTSFRVLVELPAR